MSIIIISKSFLYDGEFHFFDVLKNPHLLYYLIYYICTFSILKGNSFIIFKLICQVWLWDIMSTKLYMKFCWKKRKICRYNTQFIDNLLLVGTWHTYIFWVNIITFWICRKYYKRILSYIVHLKISSRVILVSIFQFFFKRIISNSLHLRWFSDLK